MKKGKDFWGPSFWFVIHFLSLILDTDTFMAFLSDLSRLLPCAECRQHLADNLIKLSRLVAQGNKSAFQIGHELHVMVSRQTGKKSISLDEAYAYYTSPEATGKFTKHFWIFLHSIAMVYTPENKDAFIKVIRLFPNSPLGVRARDAFNKIQLRENALESSAELFYWSFLLHHQGRDQGEGAVRFSVFKEFYTTHLDDDCGACKIR